VHVTTAATNDAYELDEATVQPVNRASMSDDITLCENILYAQDPHPQTVPGNSPPHDDERSQGVFIRPIYLL